MRVTPRQIALLLVVLPSVLAAQAGPLPTRLWVEATAETIGDTKEWTNKVEVADLDQDGRPDLLFANGGNYSDPGKPEPNRVFFNMGPGKKFVERTAEVFGPTLSLTRVIKARDLTGDGLTDIIVGTTFQTQSSSARARARSRKRRPRTCRRCCSASATSSRATWTATATSTSSSPTGVPATT
jgi:hypothetical protein